MHMISKKDLSDAEMDTLTKSCSPTKVMTASGELQTHEEAMEYVHVLDCESPRKHDGSAARSESFAMKNGYSYEWINGQKPHLITNGIRIQCNTRTKFLLWFQSLSTNSSSGSDSSTSRTLSRQRSHCSTFSSSSSSSPTSDTKTPE